MTTPPPRSSLNSAPSPVKNMSRKERHPPPNQGLPHIAYAMSRCVCVCVCVRARVHARVCVCVCVGAHMPMHAPNLLVDDATVCDGPTTLRLRPENENLHLEECSEWVHFPYFLQTNTQQQAGGIFRIIFHTS